MALDLLEQEGGPLNTAVIRLALYFLFHCVLIIDNMEIGGETILQLSLPFSPSS